ncbi:hypothetical protein AB0K09_19475 [Streptomyces sp. NPDC049577]|uniref:hypothetical protein n=1 Tax=Streptomyces sp. NPDC049577 TaxID=3155153 RepID=UPI00344655A3
MAADVVDIPEADSAVTCHHTYPGTTTRFDGAFEDRAGRHFTFTVTLPTPAVEAPKDVQVWRDGGAPNEVHVMWLPVEGAEDYTIRIFKNGDVIRTVTAPGRPPNDNGYRQVHVAPEPYPVVGQVYEYDVSVKGTDAWSQRVAHQWAGS